MKYTVETYHQIVEEVKPLLVRHWEEIALYKDKIPLSPNWEKYEAFDKAGMLHIVTVRDDSGLLVGYCVTVIFTHLHYSECIVGSNDILFIAPEYRMGSIGTRLIKFSEECLKNLGVHMVTYHVKPGHDFSPVLKRMGYGMIEYMYGKYIKEQ